MTQQIIFGDTRRVMVPPFTAASTVAVADPVWLLVTVHRSVEPPTDVGVQRVHLSLTNDDPSGRTAASVAVREHLSPGTDLVHGSVSPATTKVSGVNPIEFRIKDLACGDTADVTFQIIRYKS